MQSIKNSQLGEDLRISNASLGYKQNDNEGGGEDDEEKELLLSVKEKDPEQEEKS